MGLLFIVGIFLLIVSLSILLLIYLKLRHYKVASAFNGPPALPLLGNALEFAGIDHNEMIQRINALQTKYGSPARIWFGPHLVISIADHKNMEIVMKSSDNLNKSIHHKYFDFMNGVFLAEDERWRRLRKMVNSMFHASSMDGHIQIFNTQSKIMCDILREKTGKEAFDIKTVINDCILDIICQTAMRTPMDIQQNRKDKTSYPDDVSHIAEITMQRVSKIWLYPSFIFENTSLGKRRNVLRQKILGFVKQVIQRGREIQTDGSKNNNVMSYGKYTKSYLDVMLEYAAEEKINEERLAMEVNDLLIAGSDTSAVAASYALVMLGIDQNLQDRVYAELNEIFGDSDREATMSDLTLMTQLEMVAKETVRITCPPHMARTVDKDIKLDGDNLIIPAGSTLYMLLYRLHRNPDYWSHPNEFYPDHFLPENEAVRPKFSFLPFSYGLRICPGHKYGIYSLKVILSTVLRRYRIITDLKPQDLKYRVAIMLELANGYPIRLEPRKLENKL